MSETSPTCRIHEKHEFIKCQNPTWPGDPEGFCILHSQDQGKDPEAFKAALQVRLNQVDQNSYNFRGVFFPGPFDPDEVFGSRKFKMPVDFSWATFTGVAIFSKATFMQVADFSWATFTEEAGLSWPTFAKGADFSGATFTEGADFSGASFTEGTNFSEATFTKGVNFSGVTFTEGADFSWATFTQGADFTGATFTEGADFPWPTITKEADFTGATFTGWAEFYETTFRVRGNFSRACIGGRVIFRDINPRDEAGLAPPFIGDFGNLEFQDRGVLRFQDTSLARASFEGTDLRRPEFHHVTWNSYHGRQAIYDEVYLRQRENKFPWFWNWFWAWLSGHLALRAFALEIGHTADTTGRDSMGTYLAEEPAPPEPPWGDDYGEVERLYRNLQENYKQAGDYKNLGDFHYGEMEMHRRASKWRWFPFYWYNLYWFLSGYGERPSRALGWLAGFLLALPLIVWGFGLDRVAGGTTPGFLETFTYIFEKATFQRPLLLSNLNHLGTFISNLSLLIIPGQAALFLLALRNRLGRRR
jgi:uncharacterized protein YjbI with pentapeptide repeats